MNDASLTAGKNSLDADALTRLAQEYNQATAAMDVLSRRIDRVVLEQFLNTAPLRENDLTDKDKVTAWAETLHQSLIDNSSDGNMYQHRLITSRFDWTRRCSAPPNTRPCLHLLRNCLTLWLKALSLSAVKRSSKQTLFHR